MKQWQVLKGQNSWTLFKVISEIVNGCETMNAGGPCVSIFGSARREEDDPYYKAAEEVARLLVGQGLGVITARGPGIMEAGNRGGCDARGVSVGLGSSLRFE